MARIVFVGLGNMGLPMAINLKKAGHSVVGHDLDPQKKALAHSEGIKVSSHLGDDLQLAEIVITMLPAGQHVKKAYEESIFPFALKGCLLIDCSTIDVITARTVHGLASAKGFNMVDAPVSGGVPRATNGSLTLMVGGSETCFAQAEAILQAVGAKIIHCGPAGAGQGVKICNNMMLGIQMISVCEGFHLAHKLGLDPAKLFEVSKDASGQCWSLTSYCPQPGLVDAAPSNRDYKAGFSTAMMLKDLKLAAEAGLASNANNPLGNHAMELYQRFYDEGNGDIDFSAILKMLGK